MSKEPDRFVLGIAYQAGPDPRIKRGVDGGRDYFSKAELERACWSYMRSGCPQINAFHIDGTEDCAEPVESFIWRWADWDVGDGIVVKDGDWCLGAILSPRMWELHKAGKVNGLSPQGTARRRRVLKEGAVTVVKSAFDALDEDDDEFTELLDANVPTVALVGAGANGIPRFLISKQGGSVPGLFDPEYVRELIAKSEPTPESDPRETVTLSGSAAAIAAHIHSAPVRKADPDAGYERLVKAKYNADDLKRMASNGQAMDDESYPIADKEDLGRAIRAVGRGGSSHDAIRRHIISRARSLGASSEIPDTWNSDGSLKKEQSVTTPAGVVKDALTPVATGETDTGVDGMDPTVVLAEPDDDTAPGNPGEPGSPAWEQIDAATARKWTSIAVRLKNALGVMADRELLEAASADPDDAEAAWDLQDAQCALDYVIDTLAGFAVDEQAEADFGSEALDAIGKALAGFDPAPLDTLEALAPVRKAGRVLSSANEAAIRGAVDSLQKVLASLPQAPTTDEVAKTANEESDMPQPTTSAETTEASGEVPTMGTAKPEPAPMEKAKGDPQLVVYDEKGRLLGIVDPGDLTPVANSTAPDDGDDAAQPADDAPAADAPPTDLTPAPPAEVGTPADAVTDDEAAMTKNTPETTLGENTNEGLLKAALQDFGAQQAQVLKAALQELDQRRADQIEQITKETGEKITALTRLVDEQKGTIAKQAEAITALETAPAVREVVRNGQTPPEHLLRGQQYGAPSADVIKAREMKQRMYTADPAEANRIATEMNRSAIASLEAIHGTRR